MREVFVNDGDVQILDQHRRFTDLLDHAESADPGAEEGVGAGVTVIEPWEGYRQMSAKDVIDRARTASVAELAAMKLYEGRHRARQTVLAAVDRQLKLANGGRLA